MWRVISECPAEVVFATRLEKTQPSFSLFATPWSTQSWNDICWKDSFQHPPFQGPGCTLHFIFFFKSVSRLWMPNVIANCKVKLELWTYKSNAGSSERITNLVWENIVRENLKSVKKCHKLFIEPGFIHCEMWPQAHSVQTERKLSGWSDLIASHIHPQSHTQQLTSTKKPKISCLMSESGGQAHASVRPRAVMIHTAQSGNSCMLLQRNRLCSLFG